MHICLVTLESLNRDYPLSGGALRVYGLAYLIKQLGHKVSFLRLNSLIEKAEFEHLFSLAKIKEEAKLLADLKQQIIKLNPDLVMIEQWGLIDSLDNLDIPIICDIHGSLLWENFYKNQRRESDLKAKIMALSRCSGFIVPGLRQKYYLLAFAMSAGLAMEKTPIEVIPLYLPDEFYQEARQGKPDQTYIVGGGLWPWANLNLKQEIVTNFQKLGYQLKEYFKTPFETSLHSQDKDNPKVQGIAHIKIPQLYAKSTFAWDFYTLNIERELAITTRTMEYLYCGLPVIYSKKLELASFIEEFNLGVTFNDLSEIKDYQSLINQLLKSRENLLEGLEKYLPKAEHLAKLANLLKVQKQVSPKVYQGIAWLEAQVRQLEAENQQYKDTLLHLERQITKLEFDLKKEKAEKKELAIRWLDDLNKL